MIQIKNKKDCVGCNACVQRCPKQCISMSEDEQGFLYPAVNLDLCIECGLCEKVCPVTNQAEPRKPEHIYAAQNLDENVKIKSSSGGVFFALAKRVIEEGGVVFGAKFNNYWEVEHGYAESLQDAKSFQGSKYVQSRIRNNFNEVEKFLKDGRTVLFSGTPCQIAGLKLFLRKEYENLIAVDVVCHGVPSPLVWREYLHHIALPLGARYGKNTESVSLNGMPVITGISFRDKRLGWEKFGISIRISATEGSGKNSEFQYAIGQKEEREAFYEPLDENLYMQIFLKDLDLRPSCYACPSKCGKSRSDITLADFWGIKRHLPSSYDFNGVSLVLTNTAKGKSILETLPIESTETSYEIALKGNPAIERSAMQPRQYKKFWTSYNCNRFLEISRIVESMKPTLLLSLIHI